MSFESCKWFNKEKIKISEIIPYFNIDYKYEQNDFFNDIVHYKSNDNINLSKKIIINKIKIKNNKLDELINKKNELIENNNFKKESTKKTTLTKIHKKINNYNKVVKSRCYQIFPSEKQKNIIFNWMKECTKIYNYCVDNFNMNSKDFNLDYTKSKLIIFNNLYGNNNKPAPYDILTDEIRAFCSNIKSCLTNLHNNNINHFKIGYKNTQKSQSILIPSKSINKKGIFINLLKEMKGFDKINIEHIDSDSRLIYDKYFNKFYLKCPLYFDRTTINNRKEIVALDPGEKIFMTYYSFNNCGMIGYNIREKILQYESKIRKLQKIISTKKSNNKRVKNIKRLKRRFHKYYKKIKNIVKELHNKSALYLVKNYNKILLPEFKTSEMVKGIGKKYIKNKLEEIKDKPNNERKIVIKEMYKIRRLNKRVKFVLNMLSHYKFKQHLINKCDEYGCNIEIVTEEYTSKCCSRCGILSDNYKNREKTCISCNLKIDRDLNGSRNILIKNSKGNYKIRS